MSEVLERGNEMSREGINMVAKVFSNMQETREQLLRHCKKADGLLDKQDVLLAQLLETGKDSMKERFAKITIMKGEYGIETGE